MNYHHPRTIRIVLGLCLAAWIPLAGCSDSGSSPPNGDSPAAAQPADDGSPPQRETWDVMLLDGSRMGYVRTAVYDRKLTSGEPVVRTEVLQRWALKRSGTLVDIEVRIAGNETPDGKLLDFEHEMKLGPDGVRTTGRVVGDQLQLQRTTLGKTVSRSIPWSTENGGPFAVEQSLSSKPMQPGGKRTFRALAPDGYQLATHHLTAKSLEPVNLLGKWQELLQIEYAVRFEDGNTIRALVWTDRHGELLKTRPQTGPPIEQVRADKKLALAKTELPDMDLVVDTSVKVNRPLPGAHRSRQIRYRVHLEGDDPAETFATGPSQRVKSIGPHTAEVTVYAIRGGRGGGNPDAPDDPPTDADRRPNNMIQSDFPRIVAEAQAAAGDQQDPWRAALALERYVHRELAAGNFSFSMGFATAAEVAQTRTGDCSENAVFLAALARARGIPARVAMGLVYVAHLRVFGYHMWTEVHVDGRWVPLDATLGQGGIGAGHLKVNHSNLDGVSAFSSFVPVVNVMQQLKIEVLQVK